MKKLLLTLVVLSTVSLFVGVADMTPQQLFSGDAKALELFFTSRIPRLFAILLAGAGLSIAGLVMQQISQNRFAAPSTTGTIECAMLGYVMSVVFFGDGDHLWLVFGISVLERLRLCISSNVFNSKVWCLYRSSGSFSVTLLNR